MDRLQRPRTYLVPIDWIAMNNCRARLGEGQSGFMLFPGPTGMMEGRLLVPDEMKSKHTRTTARGFTLVELLVTITIIAALAGFTLVMLKRGGVQSKLTASLSRVR